MIDSASPAPPPAPADGRTYPRSAAPRRTAPARRTAPPIRARFFAASAGADFRHQTRRHARRGCASTRSAGPRQLRPADQLAQRREEMVRVHRDVEHPLLRRMDAGQPAGAGIAGDVAPLALRPDKTPGLDRQCAAQQREAQILPRAAALAVKQRGGNAIGEQRRGEIIEHRAEHQLRLVGRRRPGTPPCRSGTAAPGRTRPCR